MSANVQRRDARLGFCDLDCGKIMGALGIMGTVSAGAAAAASYLGRSVVQVSVAQGFGVGILAGAATVIAFNLFEKADANLGSNLGLAGIVGLSLCAGSAFTYGASAAAAAVGIAAAPITVSGAILLTVASSVGLIAGGVLFERVFGF